VTRIKYACKRQGLLRNTVVDASCIQIKPGGNSGGDLEDHCIMTLHATPHYMTRELITNNKLLSFLNLP